MTDAERIAELEACLTLFVSVAHTWAHDYSQIDQQLWKSPLGYGKRRAFITLADLKRSECALQGEYPPQEYVR